MGGCIFKKFRHPEQKSYTADLAGYGFIRGVRGLTINPPCIQGDDDSI